MPALVPRRPLGHELHCWRTKPKKTTRTQVALLEVKTQEGQGHKTALLEVKTVGGSGRRMPALVPRESLGHKMHCWRSKPLSKRQEGVSPGTKRTTRTHLALQEVKT